MGRLLKRVSLDFKWPEHKVWKGYINPYSAPDCPCCEGGYSKRYKELHKEWYGVNYRNGWNENLTQEDVQALVDANRLWGFTRRPRNEEDKKLLSSNGHWMTESNGYVPTAQEVNEWSKKGFGHDSSNAWICIKARCKKEGVSHVCEFCEGTGTIFINKEFEKLHEDFKWIEPPEGKGFQFWENTSEGSPISPVFETFLDLCAYAESNCATFGTTPDATKEQWYEMFKDEAHRSQHSISKEN